MAKDVITRFKLESTQYDSKLRDAARELADYAKTATNAGKEFDKFTQSNIDAARALGQTATSTGNAKQRVQELVGAFNDTAKVYNILTRQQQQSDFGRAMSESLQQLKQRIREAKAEMQSLGNAASSVNTGGLFGGGMMSGAKNAMGMLGMSPAMLTGIGAATAGFAALKGAIESNIETARNFEVSMSQLSSLTGKTGDDLNKLKEYAIELGSKSTLTASQVADAFKMIGSQQPQLLESSEALKAVTKNAITLAEAAGIDLATAAQTLSTSINQFGGDSSRAAEFINILAAASQKGAGDIGWLGEAVTKSGTTAKAVGTDYNELVANLEQLAKAGYDASTAGTALRSIIMSLEKQSNDEYKPSVVGLTQAFQNLNAAQLTLTQYQETAGKMFAAQAKALAENADEAARLKDEITGTNTAEEQAKTNSDNLQGSLLSLSSAWEGLNLHINSSNGFLRSCVDWLKDVVTWADQAFTAAGRAQKQLQLMQGGGNGQPTTVDKQIAQLNSGSHTQNWSTYRNQVNSYRNEIEHLRNMEDAWNKWRSGNRSADTQRLIEQSRDQYHTTNTAALRQTADNLQTMLDEYMSRALQIIKPKKADIDTSDTQVTPTTPTKTTHHATPQEQAAKSISNAEAKYQDALTLAAKQMEAGTISDAEYKKQLLSQQQRLYDAYGSAYQTYADPKYKDAQDKAADEIVRLGGEVKSATEAQEAQKKAARELEQSMKKLSDAQAETAQAIGNNDLKGYYAAQKKVAAAGGPADQTTAFTYTTGNLDAFIGSLKERISQSDVGTDLYNALTKQLADAQMLGSFIDLAYKNGIDASTLDPQTIFSKIFGDGRTAGDYIPDEFWEGMGDQMAKYLGKGVKVDTNTGGVEEDKENDDKFLENSQKVVSGLNSVASGLQQMGIKLPKGVTDVLNVANGVMSVINGVSTIISVFSTTSQSLNTAAITANTAAIGASTVTLTSSIAALIVALNANSTSNFIPFANGGIVHAAGGYFVPGNNYSGDMVPAMLNSGELILNRAQQGNLASQLQGGGMGNIRMSARISGEDIILSTDNHDNRTDNSESVESL